MIRDSMDSSVLQYQSDQEQEREARVDSLRMLDSIGKEVTGHIALLRTLKNHPVEIKIFGDSKHSFSINGTVGTLETTNGEEWVELSPAQVEGVMTMSYILPWPQWNTSDHWKDQNIPQKIWPD